MEINNYTGKYLRDPKIVREITEKFNFETFYNDSDKVDHTALILITPYDVIIAEHKETNKCYVTHGSMLDDLKALMDSLGRPKHQIFAFHCRLLHNEWGQVMKTIVSNRYNEEYEKIVTEEMLETMQLILKICSIISKKKCFDTLTSWTDTQLFYELYKNKDIPDSKGIQIIGVEIKEFIEKLNVQLELLQQNSKSNGKTSPYDDEGSGR